MVQALPNGLAQPGEAEAFRISLNLVPEVALIFTIDGTILKANPPALKLFETNEEELIGKNAYLLGVVTPEQAQEAISHMTRGETVRFETDFPTPKGTLKLELLGIPLITPTGEVERVLGLGRDVTEQKSAEREQALLAAIVESSDDAIVSLSMDLTILTWNRGAEKLLGFTAAEAIGQPTTLYIPPDKRDYGLKFLKEIQKHLDHPQSFEVPCLRKNGTCIDVWTVCFGIRDPNGQLLGMSAIHRDLTERKRAERETATLAALVNASRDAIINVSAESKIITWNPAAEKAYGYTAAEAVGKGVELFVPPEEVPQSLAATRRIVETGQPVSLEQTARRKDGTSFVSAVSLFPVRNAAGDIISVAGIGRDITQLKQIEKDLRAARDYTRGLIESSIDAMVVVDRDMRISDGNEQLAKLTEVPKRVLIGSRFDGYFTEPARATAAIEKALADGSVTHYDLVLRAASGREILVSFNASVFSRAGAVSGIFGVARDVTEQRTVQRKLAEERQYSRSLVESSPDALLVSNSELTLTDVNGQTTRLTGYGREELVGIKLASIFTEPEKAIEVVRRALDGGLVREAEASLLTKTAEEIPVSLNASMFKDGDDSTRGVIIGVRDISERKRAEKERSLLASIVDSSGDAIYSESTDRNVTSWNAAAEHLFGYGAAEIVGRNVALMVPLDRRAELLQDINLAAKSGQVERYETTRQRKDGSSVAVALTRAPIFDSSHKVVGFSVTAHDIGDRIRIEAELTAARDAALEAARAKSDFLANMSHEVRTPLNSVIGMTGLLLDTPLDPQQREFAHDVRESGEALLTLINEILDFSKLAAGKMVFEDIDFELTAALEGAVELIADQARLKGLELTVSIDSDAPQGLRGDPGRLRQVLLNLIGNAIKFTASGEVAIQVSKLSENPTQTILRFEVRDTGIGIPQEKIHLLFQPFSQVDPSTTRHFGGTGLGLSIARQLVERMGGTIAVSSTVGAGSTFWFTAKFAKPASVTKPASERFASFAEVRLLIVDDNENSLQILHTQASAWKMEVETADSADSALSLMRAAAREHPFEVALIDVKMPDVDGIELARIIKSDPILAATAVILISSVGSSNEFRARLKGVKIGGWLSKPVPQSSLYNAFVKVLVRRDDGEPNPQAVYAEHFSAEPSRNRELKLPAERKLRVLLAEDNPINRKLAKFQLKKLGVDVDCVSNGREAVEAAIRIPYDAVLMDCQMPEMDGYQATKEIRRLERAPRHTPIIALTAHALSGDRESCLVAGMDAYVSKPVKPEILERILAQAIAPASASPPVGNTAAVDSPPTNGSAASATAQSQPAKAAEPPPQ